MSGSSEYRNALPENYTLHWYAIDSVLGRGGFGITYLARDTNLNQPVAIKEFLPTDLAFRASDETIQPLSNQHAETYQWGLGRFLTEARTLAKFKHPNIVLIHSVFEANNTAYIVMEYETGQSLGEAYNGGRITTEEEFTRLLLSLMDGVECMHAQGFVHRDIKPSNIYLRENNHPILIDFGSARQALGIETRTLTTLVSPGYAPFEQYNATSENDDQGPWTDIYALGSTIYRGIAKKDPSDALTLANKRIQGIPEELEPATIAGAGRFSRRFLQSVDQALRFDPKDRPQSIAVWRDYLLGNTPLPVANNLANNHGGDTVDTAETVIAPGNLDQFKALPKGITAPPGVPDTGGSAGSPEAVQSGAADAAPPAEKKSRMPLVLSVAGLCVAGAIAAWFVNDKGGEVAPTDDATGSVQEDVATSESADSVSTEEVVSLQVEDEPVTPVPVVQAPQQPAEPAEQAEPDPLPEQDSLAEEALSPTESRSPLETLGVLREATLVSCGNLGVSQNGDRYEIGGITTVTEWTKVESSLSDLVDEDALLYSQTVLPDNFCSALTLLTQYRQSDSGTDITTVSRDGKLSGGDRLVVRINAGPAPVNYLYVDYFSQDNNVLHMLSSESEQDHEVPRNSELLLGEEGGIERWDIAPPFGTELITLLSTDKPLWATPRPEAESTAAYLESLQQVLEQFTSDGGQVSSALIRIDTSE